MSVDEIYKIIDIEKEAEKRINEAKAEAERKIAEAQRKAEEIINEAKNTVFNDIIAEYEKKIECEKNAIMEEYDKRKNELERIGMNNFRKTVNYILKLIEEVEI